MPAVAWCSRCRALLPCDAATPPCVALQIEYRLKGTDLPACTDPGFQKEYNSTIDSVRARNSAYISLAAIPPAAAHLFD